MSTNELASQLQPPEALRGELAGARVARRCRLLEST